MLNLDTHVLIDFVRGDLSEGEKRKVVGGEIAISGIVLWKLAKLVRLRRIIFDLGNSRFRALLNLIRIIPVDLEVAIASCELDFRSDSADEIIAATSLVHRIPLVTRDQRILRSKIVPIA